ncbi:Periplasmic solute binding protein [uncultured Pleomorphomonas sp.]|uniref:ABC transporter substrate-binding protein n=2 Tax=Pleomorphomonas TaxID=261933 RepID=A0A2G9WUF0_9HYPH|nr:metal ABC transporter substrate-binding protein [Pleomorphomonas carboxyditropha]PIO98325.1 ABC transporter substrate-binding protein [Pleomorphomonas carboxyditropha]SCM78068.1 Periplasmic solute binding protein [uncultured Pleomorphomonas sp.]
MNRLLVASLLAILAAGPALAADRLPVIASFSILGDMVARVGGDRIAVTTLVGPDGDAHVYEPTPDDVKAVAGAKLLVVNGLGFEGWMDRLAEASGYKGPVTVASNGVAPREMAEEEDGHDHAEADGDHDHHGVDPHAWQDVANAVIYVKNIAAGLDAADPEGKATYDANASAYVAELEALDAEARTAMAALPADRRKIITSHDAFGYFGAAYGLELLAPEGVSTESEASAADVARIIRQIREDAIPAIFVENIKDRRLIDQIAAETDAVVGGELYTDALSAKNGPAPTYVDMIRHNIGTLTEALAPKP